MSLLSENEIEEYAKHEEDVRSAFLKEQKAFLYNKRLYDPAD